MGEGGRVEILSLHISSSRRMSMPMLGIEAGDGGDGADSKPCRALLECKVNLRKIPDSLDPTQ